MMKNNLITCYKVAASILLCFLQISCSESYFVKSDASLWNERFRVVDDGSCVITEQFSRPELNHGGYCYAAVTSLATCKDRPDANRKSHETYFAFPLVQDCMKLKADRDFFASSAIGGDSFFLKPMQHVAALLRAEEKTPSSDFLSLGDQIVQELLSSQMSVLSSIQIDSNYQSKHDRYQVIFVLPKSKAVISLSINDNGAHPEWGLKLE